MTFWNNSSGLGKNLYYSLPDSSISQNFFSMAGQHDSGSELHFWNAAGKLRAIVQSRNELSHPFVGDSGRAVFIEKQKFGGTFVFRLCEIDLLEQKPAVSTLYETTSFLGYPSLIGEDIVLIVGDYFPESEFPFQGRKLAILRSSTLTIFGHAEFQTIGRACSLGGGRYLAVSAGVNFDGALPDVKPFEDSIFDLQVQENQLKVSPFLLLPPPAGGLYGLDCWGGKLAVDSVEFPASGRVIYITIYNVKDGKLLQRIDLPSGAETHVPYWLTGTGTDADIAVMALTSDNKPAVWVITLQGGAITKIELSSNRTEDFIRVEI